MAAEDTQLRPASHAALDNQDRNAVRPQTQEPYGDQELAVETKVTHERHFAGQPLETRADHDANEDLRRERYERAALDPAFRKQQKIDVHPDDIVVHSADVAIPLLGDPDDPDGSKAADSPRRNYQDR